MSAWLVSQRHIDEIVRFASGARYAISVRGTALRFDPKAPADLTKMGRMLWAENAISIKARYGDNNPECFDYTYTPTARPALPAVVIIKALDCLEYQSCEHDSYYASEAYALLRQLRDNAAARVPGYDAAPWGIDEEWRPGETQAEMFARLRAAEQAATPATPPAALKQAEDHPFIVGGPEIAAPEPAMPHPAITKITFHPEEQPATPKAPKLTPAERDATARAAGEELAGAMNSPAFRKALARIEALRADIAAQGGTPVPPEAIAAPYTADEVRAMPTQDLQAIVASTNPSGRFAAHFNAARETLDARAAMPPALPPAPAPEEAAASPAYQGGSITPDELALIKSCASRAYRLFTVATGAIRSEIDFRMDFLGAHLATPLRLQALLDAADAQFSHDAFGIAQHFDPATGEFRDGWAPRFAA
jgi:hypothetical protein